MSKRELPICPLCQNTGVHLCPDVVQPILISCSHKQCPITDLQKRFDELLKHANKLAGALADYLEDASYWETSQKQLGKYQSFRASIKEKG